LSAKNPNKKEEAALRQPQEIVEEMQKLDADSQVILNRCWNCCNPICAELPHKLTR